MTGLRHRERDPEIPARAGEPQLGPLAPAELLEIVARDLVREGSAEPAEAELVFARWKPGVSITASYRVILEDGTEEQVQLKRYTGGKARSLVGSLALDPRLVALCVTLRPFSVDATRGTLLWSFPADRVLGGLWSLHDPRRSARLLDGGASFGNWRVRKRKTRLELLRYKPERRAVYRVELGLRLEEARRRVRVAARVLPPSIAAALVRKRRELAAAGDLGLQPELLAHEPRTGIVLERWVEARPAAPDRFEHAERAGGALARLHAVPISPWVPRRAADREMEALRLFAGHAQLSRLGATVLRRPSGSSGSQETWVHGDFHPDQVALEEGGGGARLLDFDCLGRGDPGSDLASWIADHLTEQDELGPADAAGPLLEGYRSAGGRAIDGRHLAQLVAGELVHRAAGAFRRLERGAPLLARRALEQAVALISEGVLAP